MLRTRWLPPCPSVLRIHARASCHTLFFFRLLARATSSHARARLAAGYQKEKALGCLVLHRDGRFQHAGRRPLFSELAAVRAPTLQTLSLSCLPPRKREPRIPVEAVSVLGRVDHVPARKRRRPRPNARTAIRLTQLRGEPRFAVDPLGRWRPGLRKWARRVALAILCTHAEEEEKQARELFGRIRKPAFSAPMRSGTSRIAVEKAA